MTATLARGTPCAAIHRRIATSNAVSTEAAGATGGAGAMVTLAQLPAVGSRIRLSVPGARGSHIETVAEVLRLVRDLRQPLASLSIIKAKKEWRGMVWEPARLRATQPAQSDEAKDKRDEDARG